MGFFDRIKRGKQPKTDLLNNNVQEQPVTVDPKVGSPENQNLEGGYDYKNLFIYALGLDKTLKKMGVDNIDLEELLAKENIQEKIGDDAQRARCKQGDLTISFRIDKDEIAVDIDKASNGLEGHKVRLFFDKETYVETERAIFDYITESGKKQPINQITIKRTPGRIEQVEYWHLVKRTWQEKQEINASIDDVYRQTPGGSKILGTPEEIEALEAWGIDYAVDDRYYPSYLEDTVLIKQIDLSNVPGNISSLESLHGLDDSEISKLAGVRDSNAEEKCSRISSKIFSSYRGCQYLRNMLYPTLLGNVFSDRELVDDYKNTIKRNFEKDREKSDKQNQSTDIYNANGTPITIYDNDGTPITKAYIAQLIREKEKNDARYEAERKSSSERGNSSDGYEFDFD